MDLHPERRGASSGDAPSLRLTPRVLRGLRLAVAVVVGLVALGHVAFIVLRHGLGLTYALGLVQFLNLDDEESLGTWLSSALMLSCSVLSAAAALLARHRRDRWQRNWWVLAVVFALLSLDESTAMHENLIKPVRSALDLSGAFYFAWVLPVSALGLLFLLSQVRFLRDRWRPVGRGLVVAGLVFVGAAVGLELLEGLLITDGRRDGFLYAVVTGLQEVGELTGMGLALYALLAYLVRDLGNPTVRFLPQSR